MPAEKSPETALRGAPSGQ